MTQVNPTTQDELESLRIYMSLAFPSAEIRTSRPVDADEYDIIIEPPTNIIDTMRGTYLSEVTMPVTIQQWVDDYATAQTTMEAMRRLFSVGIAPGNKSRVPVWDCSAGDPDLTANPPPAPIYFMRVVDSTSRVMPTDVPQQYVCIIDLRLTGWRLIGPDLSSFPLIQHTYPKIQKPS